MATVGETTTNSTSKGLMTQTGVVLFTLGLITIIAVFILFAAGFSSLPMWLSVAGGVFTPLGLLLGLISLVREHRQQ